MLEAEESAIRQQVGAGALQDYNSDKVGMSYMENVGRADGVRLCSMIEDRFEDHERIIDESE